MLGAGVTPPPPLAATGARRGGQRPPRARPRARDAGGGGRAGTGGAAKPPPPPTGTGRGRAAGHGDDAQRWPRQWPLCRLPAAAPTHPSGVGGGQRTGERDREQYSRVALVMHTPVWGGLRRGVHWRGSVGRDVHVSSHGRCARAIRDWEGTTCRCATGRRARPPVMWSQTNTSCWTLPVRGRKRNPPNFRTWNNLRGALYQKIRRLRCLYAPRVIPARLCHSASRPPASNPPPHLWLPPSSLSPPPSPFARRRPRPTR